MTTDEEVHELVEGVVENPRDRIVREKNELIQNIVENLKNFREMNSVFSEVRRRMDDE